MNRQNSIDTLTRVPDRFPVWVTWLAFGIGLTGAVSLRLILVVREYRPELVRFFWYVGICGNLIFFLFRSFITHRRRKLINDLNLAEKLRCGDTLGHEDCQALQYLVGSLQASKERWNYFVIFVFSVAAIAWDLWISM